ncbi:MAG: TlyA family RNA methyltransferase [Bdellovibrionales bacterium]|nr:TlyA family RNA methyltransferase [Bdellovibrionales bacterium]
MSSKARIDILLVRWGFARSRTQAQEMIQKGCVLFNGEVIKMTSFQVEDSESAPSDLQVTPLESARFVSRSGQKLEGALSRLHLNVTNMIVLDIGQSTGGFTDCLLQRGASRVVGIDVGHDQLHPSLRSDPRVVTREKTNARDLSQGVLDPLMPQARFDLIVVDVSFISLEHILPGLQRFKKPLALVIALVKPQFELGADALDKHGVVKDPSKYESLQTQIQVFATRSGFSVLDYFESELEGAEGNREFFIVLR